MTDRERIANFYNLGAEEEYARLTKTPLHEAEFELTADLLKEYIQPSSFILDVGCGPGRYSEFLLEQKNCSVGLVDLSETSLNEFVHRIDTKCKNRILFIRKSCATDLGWIDDSSFDSVLLMGPLYHLIDERERQTAIAHCRRILKSGGYVFAAFLSLYPVFPRLLENDASLLRNSDFIDKLVNQGLTRTTFENRIIDQFRCWPTQARRMMEEGGFRTVRIRNLEGVGSFFVEQQVKVLNNEKRKKAWFDILRMTCENPDLLGATLHFLYVGRKPE